VAVEVVTSGECAECLIDLVGARAGAAQAAAELGVVGICIAGMPDTRNGRYRPGLWTANF